MRRIPTEKQAARLRVLANPNLLLVSGARPHHRPLLRRGWLEAETQEPLNGLRITPAGLRALADALEAYGRSV
jgi:hypothetical protein